MDAVQIEIGRLKDRPDTWVVVDDYGLLHREFDCHADAALYASQEAFKLRLDSWGVEIRGKDRRPNEKAS
ncbi:hypothetical protein RDV64_01580 [Acuticoccus sp. MNP-M23]|uniref:hypothetical protein n=1 Tax=Acuticoccus sp. MNP-M23 TaxID=3072793 RepID=UPI0028155B4F|nr:hypothetical protein [Acuticoccus sp. MNP-M23]WMS43123.1 hypothetical protein RDV64_01580 [Acuticoccus sp. MNP-M23]